MLWKNIRRCWNVVICVYFLKWRYQTSVNISCPVRVKSKNIQENAEFKRNGRKSSGRIARWQCRKGTFGSERKAYFAAKQVENYNIGLWLGQSLPAPFLLSWLFGLWGLYIPRNAENPPGAFFCYAIFFFQFIENTPRNCYNKICVFTKKIE